MPLCTITTNVSGRNLHDDFITKLSHRIADMLEKPYERMKIIIHPDTRMLVNDTTSPAAAILEIWAIKKFTIEKTKAYTSEIKALIGEELEIENERIGCIFHELSPEQIAIPPAQGQQ